MTTETDPQPLPEGGTVQGDPLLRLEALKAAEAFVERLSPKTNARGYADGPPLKARVAEVLRVAYFLLGEEVEE